MGHEDRQHDLAVAAQDHGQMKEMVDQFADLAKTDRDFALREQAQNAAQNNPILGNTDGEQA